MFVLMVGAAQRNTQETIESLNQWMLARPFYKCLPHYRKLGNLLNH